MAKRKKSSKPWVLLHEIFLEANKCRTQEGRRDVVRLVKMNHSGKVLQSKPIPQGMVAFFYRRHERFLQIDSEFAKEFESIETVRYYEHRTFVSIDQESLAHAVVA